MRKLLLGLGALAVLGGAASAQRLELLGGDDAPGMTGMAGRPVVQSGVARGVVAELDRAGHSLVAWRYVSLADDMISTMVADEIGRRETYRLDGGREYVFQAACDRMCTDLDMELSDEHGAVLASDTSDARWPVVTFTPPATGRYTLRVWVKSCFDEYCYVGVRGYGRTEG